MERVFAGHRYLFAVRSPGKVGDVSVEFTVPGVGSQPVKVRCESRTLDIHEGRFQDRFSGPYAVHVYEF